MDFSVFANCWWQMCLVALCCYLIGGINFAILFTKCIKHEDIRTVGSGNAGTTNVFRVFGLGMGALTFLCDSLKGVVACLVCKFVFANCEYSVAIQYWAGLFAVLGHIFSPYHKFRGGKGVATSVGVCITMQPLLMVCCVLPIIAVIFITDRMSVMSILLSLFVTVWHWAVLLPQVGLPACVFVSVMFAVVLFAHRHNVVRILQGKELRTGVRKAVFGKGEQTSDKGDEK